MFSKELCKRKQNNYIQQQQRLELPYNNKPTVVVQDYDQVSTKAVQENNIKLFCLNKSVKSSVQKLTQAKQRHQ